MKYWFDTEFIEDGRTIDLISIGMVAEDGREFYAVSTDADLSKASDWVKENVLVHLPDRADPVNVGPIWMPRFALKRRLLEFIGDDPKPEFWAYYADYDWVVLCQLFGTMMDLPRGWPMYCRDLKQRCDEIGNPRLPQQKGINHHALADAQWVRSAWIFLHGFADFPNKTATVYYVACTGEDCGYTGIGQIDAPCPSCGTKLTADQREPG